MGKRGKRGKAETGENIVSLSPNIAAFASQYGDEGQSHFSAENLGLSLRSEGAARGATRNEVMRGEAEGGASHDGIVTRVRMYGTRYVPLRLNGRTRTATFILSVVAILSSAHTGKCEARTLCIPGITGGDHCNDDDDDDGAITCTITSGSRTIRTSPLHHSQPIPRVLVILSNDTTSHRAHRDTLRHIAESPCRAPDKTTAVRPIE